MQLSNGVVSSTTSVWEMLVASKVGDLEKIKELAAGCHELLYAQYNYTPPIHFAVREGHEAVVKFLLDEGAHDPDYKIYPFQERLQTIANDRGHTSIESMLNDYATHPERWRYKGDNGSIDYERGEIGNDFQRAVDKGDYERVSIILSEHPEYAKDLTFFWGEGIMLMPAKEKDFRMLELLMKFGARVPDVIKWGQFYYFEKYESAEFLLKHGMNPNTMSWHHVTILHDMAQKGDIPKAELLIHHGADINSIEEEYQSTPLGLAARWGHIEMVKYLLENGADPTRSGAPWSTPLSWSRKKNHPEIEKLLVGVG